MKNSKETRTCIGCRNKNHKHNLIRIVKTKDKEVAIDFEQVLEGRGAYLCNDKQCFEKIVKGKKLNKALKTNIDDKKYNELRGVIFDRER